MKFIESLNALIDQNLHSLGWPTEGMVQLLMAALAGGLVGIERELRGRQAGFRTNLLVCVGSALVMIVSSRMAFRDWPSHGQGMSVQVSIDPARIAYGVMTGVGFLGAGAILKNGRTVRGLTTAAGLWCVAALGLAAGMGQYVIMLFATLLVLVTLWVLDHLEELLPRLHYREITLRRRWEPKCVAGTIARLKEAGLKVVDVSYDRTANLHDVDMHFRIAFTSKTAFYEFENYLATDTTHELLAVRE